MQIKHLRHKTIDYTRWDKCISESYNQLTYAYTWYLDIVSPNWEALVSDNYEYVMPLPIKRRYGISYLVQPILTQQLGIFSKKAIDDTIVQLFIKELPSFSYELNLNEHNYHSKARILPNYLLNLQHSYDQIASQYSKNTKRNIDKANKSSLKVKSGLSITDFLSFYNSVHKNYKQEKQSIVKELVENGIKKMEMTLHGVFSDENNLIAALCLIHSTNRLTYLLPISNTEGKASAAMFLLIDKIIREESGKNYVLDFEGSRMEGIARFYKGFGAKNHPYYILKRFRPAFLIRKLSKQQ